MTPPATAPSPSTGNHLGLALALALAAAVSLGLARFSYALLLPTMRAELHWSYFVAGAMNTANAAGYLAGALLAPRWFARFDAARVLTAGAVVAALALAAHAFARGDAALYALRTLTGAGSAATFIGGGLLAARARPARRASGPRARPVLRRHGPRDRRSRRCSCRRWPGARPGSRWPRRRSRARW